LSRPIAFLIRVARGRQALPEKEVRFVSQTFCLERQVFPVDGANRFIRESLCPAHISLSHLWIGKRKIHKPSKEIHISSDDLHISEGEIGISLREIPISSSPTTHSVPI